MVRSLQNIIDRLKEAKAKAEEAREAASKKYKLPPAYVRQLVKQGYSKAQITALQNYLQQYIGSSKFSLLSNQVFGKGNGTLSANQFYALLGEDRAGVSGLLSELGMQDATDSQVDSAMAYFKMLGQMNGKLSVEQQIEAYLAMGGSMEMLLLMNGHLPGGGVGRDDVYWVNGGSIHGQNWASGGVQSEQGNGSAERLVGGLVFGTAETLFDSALGPLSGLVKGIYQNATGAVEQYQSENDQQQLTDDYNAAIDQLYDLGQTSEETATEQQTTTTDSQDTSSSDPNDDSTTTTTDTPSPNGGNTTGSTYGDDGGNSTPTDSEIVDGINQAQDEQDMYENTADESGDTDVNVDGAEENITTGSGDAVANTTDDDDDDDDPSDFHLQTQIDQLLTGGGRMN